MQSGDLSRLTHTTEIIKTLEKVGGSKRNMRNTQASWKLLIGIRRDSRY